MEVTAYDDAGLAAGSDMSDVSGDWTIEDLPAGTNYVCFDATGTALSSECLMDQPFPERELERADLDRELVTDDVVRDAALDPGSESRAGVRGNAVLTVSFERFSDDFCFRDVARLGEPLHLLVKLLREIDLLPHHCHAVYSTIYITTVKPFPKSSYGRLPADGGRP